MVLDDRGGAAASPVLELRGVAKLYGRTAALRAVHLRLERGQSLALLGPNGSGKTTLLKLIAGAIAPTVGSGTVLGMDIRGGRNARAEVGLLAAETYLYEDLTARENLRFAVTMAGRRPAPEEIDRALGDVGLLSNAADRVRSFSSGMRRRLALARLLLLRPALLLLDEPYNSLDAAAAGLVDDVVRGAVGEGRSVIMATHDASRALDLVDSVASLERGKIAYLGSVHGYRRGHAQYVG